MFVHDKSNYCSYFSFVNKFDIALGKIKCVSISFSFLILLPLLESINKSTPSQLTRVLEISKVSNSS